MKASSLLMCSRVCFYFDFDFDLREEKEKKNRRERSSRMKFRDEEVREGGCIYACDLNRKRAWTVPSGANIGPVCFV